MRDGVVEQRNENARVPMSGFTIREGEITPLPHLTCYYFIKKKANEVRESDLPVNTDKYVVLKMHIDGSRNQAVSYATAYLLFDAELERDMLKDLAAQAGSAQWNYSPLSAENLIYWPGNAAKRVEMTQDFLEPEQAEIAEGNAAVEVTSEGEQSSEATRRPPSPQKIVTVLDFEIANIARWESIILLDLLSTALFETRRFRVLDRSQRQTILEEVNFSYSKCVDESCQIRVGKMLAADYIVVGSLAKVSSRHILNTELLDVEAGETVATSHDLDSSMEELIDGIPEIAARLDGS